MKKYVIWLSLILIALFGSTAVSTKAQSAYGIRANVPFDFTVGDKTLHGGKISARRLNGSDAGPMSISNLDSGDHVFRAAGRVTNNDSSDQAKLVFHKYGDRYFLAQVWTSGFNAWELAQSRSERAIRREARLAKDSKPELVTVFVDMQ